MLIVIADPNNYFLEYKYNNWLMLHTKLPSALLKKDPKRSVFFRHHGSLIWALAEENYVVSGRKSDS